MGSTIEAIASAFKESANMPVNVGPLQSGHYVQVGLGMGFYVPESDFEALQERANQTHKIQFLGVTKAGIPLTGSREQILDDPNTAGVCAWIVPAGHSLF